MINQMENYIKIIGVGLAGVEAAIGQNRLR